MLVVLLMKSSICYFSFPLILCFFHCLKKKHERIFCIGTEIPIWLFWNKWIHTIWHIILCHQNSAVINHQSSVSLVSLGLCLFLFPPRHTSFLPPLCHLQANGIRRIFVSTTSQLNSFDSFEACCVTNNLALLPLGAINLLHRLQQEHPLYPHWQIPRIQEPLAHCLYSTVDHLTHCLCSQSWRSWWLPQQA